MRVKRAGIQPMNEFQIDQIVPPAAALLVVVWNAAIYLDSSALTAGIVAAAEKDVGGATMGVHSMAGYTGGFLGPLGVGLALDLCGSDTVIGWLWVLASWRWSR